jgi:hypothetical protein
MKLTCVKPAFIDNGYDRSGDPANTVIISVLAVRGRDLLVEAVRAGDGGYESVGS